MYSLDFGCDGGYILCGAKTDSGSFYSNVYLIKTDENGNLIWSNEYGGAYDEGGYCIQHVNDGYIVTGYSDITGEGDKGDDVFVVKVNCNGELTFVSDLKGKNDFTISPNPATTEIKITNLSPTENQISIINLLGQQVKSINVSHVQSTILPVSDLPAGIYVVTIFDGEKIVCKKFVKE